MIDTYINPVDFVITNSNVHDIKVAPVLIEQNDLT